MRHRRRLQRWNLIYTTCRDTTHSHVTGIAVRYYVLPLHAAITCTRTSPRVHAYLVPYRALAAEVYESFVRELAEKGAEGARGTDDAANASGRPQGGGKPRVKIATGDHRDPFYPEDTDILVSTFERFSALLASPDLRLGRVVVDEIHLLADESRGPALESLRPPPSGWRLT